VFIRTSVFAAAALGMTLVFASPAQATNTSNNSDHKIGICHATGSAKNPYVFIVVDTHAEQAHSNHQDGRDIIGAKSQADCPKGSVAGASTKATPTPQPGKGGLALSTAVTKPSVLPTVGSSLAGLLAAAGMAVAAGVYTRRHTA
jgi:hypothetical protein